MSKKGGLGRGLGSLLSSTEAQYEAGTGKKGETTTEVEIGSIRPNPFQPRKTFNKEKLEELAQSIKKHGIIQPLVVVKKGINYELVAGERRLRAAKIAGLATVPVLVKKFDETQMRELSLIENIQRHDLNPIEEARAIKELMETCGYTQSAVAERLGCSRASVANLLRMLTLPKEIIQLVLEEKATMGQIKPVLALDKASDQKKLAEYLVKYNWSARTMENLVRLVKEGRELPVLEEEPAKKGGKKDAKPKKPVKKDVHYRQFEEDLIGYLGTKVRIISKGENVGRIEIDYYSPDDLDRICDLLKGKKDAGKKGSGKRLTV